MASFPAMTSQQPTSVPAGGGRVDPHISTLLDAFSGVCTYDLLHRARVERYGEGYREVAPGQHPLLSLNSVCHVPSDSPHTREIEGKAHELADTLFQWWWEENRMKWVDATASLGTRLMGSYSTDTKVGDMDELDFLCLLQWNSPLLIDKNLPRELGRHMTSLENYVTVRSNATPVAHVSRVFQHGPATCVEITWCCCHGHQHKLDMDFTLGIEYDIGIERLREPSQYHFWYEDDILNRGVALGPNLIAMLLDQLEGYILGEKIIVVFHRRNAIPQSWCPSNRAYHVTSVCFDAAIHRLINHTTSGNALHALRCLKVMCGLLLPQRQTVEKVEDGHGQVIKSYVSSHVLKTVVADWCREVWEKDTYTPENIVVAVLEKLAKPPFIPAHGQGLWPPMLQDRVTRGELGRELSPTEKEYHQVAIEDLQALADYTLWTAVTREAPPVEGAEGSYTGALYLLGRGLYHKVTLSQLHTLQVSEETETLLLYRLPPSERHLPYYRHPLMQWCTARVHARISSHLGADLTAFPPTSSLLPQAWHHYVTGGLDLRYLRDPLLLTLLDETLTGLTLGEAPRHVIISMYHAGVSKGGLPADAADVIGTWGAHDLTSLWRVRQNTPAHDQSIGGHLWAELEAQRADWGVVRAWIGSTWEAFKYEIIFHNCIDSMVTRQATTSPE